MNTFFKKKHNDTKVKTYVDFQINRDNNNFDDSFGDIKII